MASLEQISDPGWLAKASACRKTSTVFDRGLATMHLTRFLFLHEQPFVLNEDLTDPARFARPADTQRAVLRFCVRPSVGSGSAPIYRSTYAGTWNKSGILLLVGLEPTCFKRQI